MVESILVYLIGLYVGALILTGAFTRLLNFLLRRTIENPTRSVLVCILHCPFVSPYCIPYNGVA